MTLEFKKKASATQSYGRGSDQRYTPSSYAVFLNGEEVASIVGQARGHREPTEWEIRERFQYDHRAPRWNIGGHLFPTLKEAKRYVIQNVKKKYPGAK
jgi:hypothetical protein